MAARVDRATRRCCCFDLARWRDVQLRRWRTRTVLVGHLPRSSKGKGKPFEGDGPVLRLEDPIECAHVLGVSVDVGCWHRERVLRCEGVDARMKRALVALTAGLLVATLSPIASNASGPAPAQSAASVCESGEAPSVEVVLLVDQSKSLGQDVLDQIEEAVLQVGNRLVVPVQEGLNVKFGVAKFGEYATAVRPLSPVAKNKAENKFEQLGSQLSKLETREDYTDYVAGLNLALEMFDTGDPEACKVLLWFTDGMYDVGPTDLDKSSGRVNEDEASALSEAVCGQGSIAQRVGARNISTFAVLLKDQSKEDWNRWYEKYPQLQAGLSSMQAITGDSTIENLPVDDYAGIELCQPLVTANASLKGEVLVGPGALPGILSTRLCKALGCEPVGQCPEVVPVDSSRLFPDGGMPPGLMLTNVYVTAVAGEIGSVSAVLPDGGPPRPLQLSSEDNRLDRDELRNLPGGWQLEISSAGEIGLEVCIQYDKPRLEEGQVAVSATPATVVNGVGTQIELTIDWSPAFDDIDPAGVIESWELAGDGLDVVSGSLTDPDSVVVVTVVELDEAEPFNLDSVELLVTPWGSDEQVVFQGQIDPSIEVRTVADRPRLECSGTGEHGFGELMIGGPQVEVPRGESTFSSSETCKVFPPRERDPDTGVGYVTVTFVPTEVPDMRWEDIPWELQTADGKAVEPPFTVSVGDEPVELSVVAATKLENREYDGGGLFTLRTEWSRETTLDFTQEATFEFKVTYIPRSDPWWALIITLIVTAIAMLVSLALLRLMNHLLVRIPEPGAFYFRVVPVRISPDPVLGASWSPTGDGFSSESRPVGADSPGRDLKAGPLRVHRSLGPVWKPFSSPFSRLKGDRVIRSTPSGRRPGTAPVAFPSLTALMTSAGERSSDGSFAGQIVVLYPRRHEFDEMQVRQDVDRLVGPVGEDVGRLSPDTYEVFDPKPSGSRAPERSGSESASGGAGSVAPPSRSGPPSAPARDTSTPDREPPRREPPRREPPPRGR